MIVPGSRHAALYEDSAADGGEDGDDDLDNLFDGFFFHNDWSFKL